MSILVSRFHIVRMDGQNINYESHSKLGASREDHEESIKLTTSAAGNTGSKSVGS